MEKTCSVRELKETQHGSGNQNSWAWKTRNHNKLLENKKKTSSIGFVSFNELWIWSTTGKQQQHLHIHTKNWTLQLVHKTEHYKGSNNWNLKFLWFTLILFSLLPLYKRYTIQLLHNWQWFVCISNKHWTSIIVFCCYM